MSKATFQNAKTDNGEEISINKAIRGANGYLCIGCGSKMMACKGTFQVHHFRHLADTGAARECTWSDETYRHKVAKDILQITKSIAVPPVKIPVPPEYGEDEIKIRDATIVQAHKVLIERNVYLDEMGTLRFSRSEAPSEKLICVKPDVLFLDSQDNIILMIEICATHKVDAEKQAKLMEIGIDTVEVRIPPVPEKDDIEKIFKKHNHTLWLYNNERENTIFDPNTHSLRRKSAGAVLGRGAFPGGEDARCRAFRLKNIIRQLEAYMATGDFRAGKAGIDGALGEARMATEQAEREYRGFSDGILREAEERLQQEYGLASEAHSRYREVEERYKCKAEELRGQERELDEEEAELSAAFEAELGRLEKQYRDEERVVERGVRELESRVNNLRREIYTIELEEASVGSEERRLAAAVRAIKEQLGSAKGTYKQLQDELARVGGETERAGEDLHRLRGIRKEFSDIQDKAIGGRSN